jgi:hypothetical protein
MSETKGQTYIELCRKLYTKGSENIVNKMAKLRERKIRDFNQVKCIKDQVKCIKDETDRFLVKDDEIKNI